MSRPKKRKKGKHRRPSKAAERQTPPPQLSVAELLANGDYTEAEALLRSQMTDDPSDDQWRQLAKCLAGQKKFSESQESMEQITSRQPFDWLYEGWLFYDKGQIEEARGRFEDYIELQPDSAYGYFWLAEAHNHSRAKVENAEQLALSNYEKATACPDCFANVYLRIVWLLPWTDEGRQRKLKLYQEALERFPDNGEIRLKLSQFLIAHVDRQAEGLEVLRPMLDGNGINSRALWQAHEAHKKLGRHDEAVNCITSIPRGDLTEVSPCQIVGELYLESANYDSALAVFDEGTADATSRDRAVLLFGKAAALVGLQQFEDAHTALRAAAFSLLNCDGFSCEGPIFVGREGYGYDLAAHLRQTCKVVLNGELDLPPLFSEIDLHAALAYALYQTGDRYGDESPGYDLLLKAAEHLDHPVLSRDLEDYYYDNGDIALGLLHHLRYCRWLYEGSGNDPSSVEHLASARLSEDQLPSTKKECKAILKAFMDELRTCEDTAEIRSIFLPAYLAVVNRSLRHNEDVQRPTSTRTDAPSARRR